MASIDSCFAGVDDEHVRVGGIAGEAMAGRLGESQHHLGVDEVLGTSERDQADFHASVKYTGGKWISG